MSLFSKIGKRIKKIKLRSVLIGGAAIGALAIPGVGAGIAAGVAKAGSLIGRGGVAAGKIAKATGGAVRSAASGIGGGISEAAGSVADTASSAADTLREDSGSLEQSRSKVLDAIKRGSAAVGDFQASGKEAATAGFLQGILGSIPPVAWLAIAGVVVFLMVRKK